MAPREIERGRCHRGGGEKTVRGWGSRRGGGRRACGGGTQLMGGKWEGLDGWWMKGMETDGGESPRGRGRGGRMAGETGSRRGGRDAAI